MVEVDPVDLAAIEADLPSLRRLLGESSGSRASIEPSIAYGYTANAGQFPSMVSLQYSNGQGGYVHLCGGTLISPNLVLTAGELRCRAA